ncbi:MAG: host attachment family protein [Erythrobacter sp.]
MILKTGTFALVADGRRLILLRNDGTATAPRLVTVAEEEAPNPPTHDQGSDRPGRTQASSGERRSGYGDTDWHEQREADFARHAAGVLEQAASGGGDAPIVVIAAPRTLGVLRDHYGRQTKARLACEIDKDLAGLPSQAILAAIMAHEPV